MFDPEKFDPEKWGDALKHLEDVPYDVSRTRLYTGAELFDAFDPADPESMTRCLDARVAQHVQETGALYPEPMEMYARTLHDHQIRKAMYEFLGWFEQNRVVGVMGGHDLLRTDVAYRRIVEVARRLTEKGYVMISGGGPGAMEATHLGAWLAGRSIAEVDEALAILAEAPSLHDQAWLATAFAVMARFPRIEGYMSLAVPTWFYAEEPPTPFATHIAKFFENSIRENVLLSEAYGGIIFMPGGAGTLQEVFQEAVQNHYLTQGFASPMVFVDRAFWSDEVQVFPLLKNMIQTGRYRHMAIALAEEPDEIIAALEGCAAELRRCGG